MATTGKKKKSKLTPGERRRVRQLVACLVLFCAVFLGRGVNAAPFDRLSETVGTIVRSDTDFQAVFARLGQSFSEGEPAVETFRALWSGVFTREDEQESENEEGQKTDQGEPKTDAQEAEVDGQTA